jgi:hypothetical protein
MMSWRYYHLVKTSISTLPSDVLLSLHCRGCTNIIHVLCTGTSGSFKDGVKFIDIIEHDNDCTLISKLQL